MLDFGGIPEILNGGGEGDGQAELLIGEGEGQQARVGSEFAAGKIEGHAFTAQGRKCTGGCRSRHAAGPFECLLASQTSTRNGPSKIPGKPEFLRSPSG